MTQKKVTELTPAEEAATRGSISAEAFAQVMYWITYSGLKEMVHMRPPKNGPHLTVWRFDELEVTVTFNHFWFHKLQSTEEFEWRAVKPIFGGWENAGPAEGFSRFWKRDYLSQGGRKDG